MALNLRTRRGRVTEQVVHALRLGVRRPNGAGAGGAHPAGAITETGGRVAAPGGMTTGGRAEVVVGTAATTGGRTMAGGTTRAGVARIGGRGDRPPTECSLCRPSEKVVPVACGDFSPFSR